MKKILFPTDFSAASLNAFEYALRLAAKTQAEVVTLHVYDLPGGSFTDYYDYLTENYNISELGQFENFKSEAPKLREIAEKLKLDHVKMSHVLERGEVVETIVSVQMAERADCIVIGTKGASGLKETFLGSVAEEVINRSKGMVLAIPEKCLYQPVRHALFLTEFEKMEFSALEALLDVPAMSDVEIHALQIKEHHEKKDDAALAKWKKHFAGSKVMFNILASTSVEETIMDFIEIEDIQLVSIGTTHKNFLERLFFFSLARNLAYHSEIPVLSIPKGAKRDESGTKPKKSVAKKAASSR